MRSITKLSILCLTAGVVSACKPDEIIRTEDIPTAGVRFINAVPDTMALDFRFVDLVESNAHFRIAFRNNVVTTGGVPASTQIQYKGARAGARQFRIFLNDTLQSVASTVVKDSTLNLVAGTNYTVILWGYANPGGPNRPAGAPAMRLTVIEETVADPGANVALRVLNATPTAIDVRTYPASGTAPAAATFANVAPLTASTYVTTAPAQTRYNVQPAGGGAALFADPLALIGAAATVDIEAAPGTTVAGSAVTLIVFPRSVAGSRAPNVTTPSGSFMWDRRPPRTCSPLC